MSASSTAHRFVRVLSEAVLVLVIVIRARNRTRKRVFYHAEYDYEPDARVRITREVTTRRCTRALAVSCAFLATLLTSCASHDNGGASSSPTPTPTVTPTATPLDPQAACAALQDQTIGGAEISSARYLPTTASYTAHCRVLGTIPPQLSVDMRLPTMWSGRALFIGGGGLNGIVFPVESLMFNPSIANAGYVTIGTDSGHRGAPTDGSWALNDPVAVENYAYRSTHEVLAAARAIIAARYSRPPDKAYFFGESTGGREGLIEAQRWPEDFDGIVSLEPVYNLSALVLAANRVAQQVFATPGGRLSPEKLQTLGHTVLAACDDLDGIEDGIISNVAACHFDPATLRCADATSEEVPTALPAVPSPSEREARTGANCLTDMQIVTVNLVHAHFELGLTLANGVDSYPGWPVGHEDHPGGWQAWITGSRVDPSTSLGFVLSDQFVRFLIARDPTLDALHFTPAAYADELLDFSVLVDATDPDLSAFAARGGKLILWHGLADYAVSAKSTARYYEQIVDAMGREQVDEFVRFYTSPGVDHLSGGPGAATTDFLAALTDWVEEGIAPADLVSTKVAAGMEDPVLSRPLCRYPAYPRYNGDGDPDLATSFHCEMP